MKKIIGVLGLSFLLFSGAASAVSILHTANNVGGAGWEYSFTLDYSDGAPGVALEEFAIFFDVGLYDNLAVTGSALNWDPLVIQPDPGLPDDGFVDWLALGGLLNPGDILSGFSVSFDFLGLGTPGSLFYEFVDPFTFDVLASGLTVSGHATTVPEPGTIGLMLAGLLLVVAHRRRRSLPTRSPI